MAYRGLIHHRIRPLVGAMCCVNRSCPSVFTHGSISASFILPGGTGGIHLGCVMANRKNRSNNSRFIRGHGVLSISNGRVCDFIP